MTPNRSPILLPLAAAGLIAACHGTDSTGTSPGPISFHSNPCGSAGTVHLATAETALFDCSNGGTTVTFEGNGASYLVVAQLAGDQGPNDFVDYSLATGTLTAASASVRRSGGVPAFRAASAVLPTYRPLTRQRAFDMGIREEARRSLLLGRGRAALLRPALAGRTLAAVTAPPPLGSLRTFHIRSNLDPVGPTWKNAGTTLAYVGTNLLVYVDTLAPAAGFTPAQLQAFSRYADQTLFGIVSGAFGQPSDVDDNGRAIMVMSPIVNAMSPAAACATQGFVAGFFDPVDFDDGSDPNSNQGEVFYTIVPDPNAQVSCAHTVAGVGNDVPATFLHEMQHLIAFSQHVVIEGGGPLSSWLDEGLSIAAEELGSVFYEQRCPPPACRTDPAQIFPDSAQGFVQGFLFDSYQYALLPDTASITLHSDDEFGSSWRGGAWLLVRWLGDQFGTGVYRQLERGPGDGLTAISTAAGQPFPGLFANFGIALYTDSLPGLPRTTAHAANRFVSRNLRQLWARLFATSGGIPQIPLAFPVQLFSISNDTSSAIMSPGTMSFFRLDTPTGTPTVSIRFSTPAGGAFPAGLSAQLGVFRLPPSQ